VEVQVLSTAPYISKTYQLAPGPYLASFGTFVVQDRSGPVGTEWGRSRPNRHFCRPSAMVDQANREADKLGVCDPAILLKPHNEAKAKVVLRLSDAGRLSVSALAPTSFRS
jgi:hypothetical protein